MLTGGRGYQREILVIVILLGEGVGRMESYSKGSMEGSSTHHTRPRRKYDVDMKGRKLQARRSLYTTQATGLFGW